jgi:serine/threonine protein kinase
MPLTPGTRLGVYEISALAGKGGMGEVYVARDSKLERVVAIKVLPEGLASDPVRLARFEREARLLASLNHPHIAQIYELEHADGIPALVMELVDGPTLADHLAQNKIPLREALRIARQIGEALEAAHERGIVHRDLKPSNIQLTSQGEVKVLDFGLATMRELDPARRADLSTKEISSPNAIVGTPAYMAPEQAKGEPATHAADVWAFGCVLFALISPSGERRRPRSWRKYSRANPIGAACLRTRLRRFAARCATAWPRTFAHGSITSLTSVSPSTMPKKHRRLCLCASPHGKNVLPGSSRPLVLRLPRPFSRSGPASRKNVGSIS